VKPRDIADLVLLAALWGASFLFMRVAAPQFGPVPLAALRVIGAALLLLPLLVGR
jgi:drug/metabolite transporter (DMT)-like permease